MSVTHKYSIICDDVRREDNGKLIILGMYVGIIVVQSFPVILPTFTVLTFFEDDRPGEWNWKASIQFQSLERNQTLGEVRGFAKINPGQGVMPIKFGGLRFDEKGLYNAVVEIEGQREPLAVLPFNVLLPSQLPGGQSSPLPGR